MKRTSADSGGWRPAQAAETESKKRPGCDRSVRSRGRGHLCALSRLSLTPVSLSSDLSLVLRLSLCLSLSTVHSPFGDTAVGAEVAFTTG
jgi:hypothetical protein